MLQLSCMLLFFGYTYFILNTIWDGDIDRKNEINKLYSVLNALRDDLLQTKLDIGQAAIPLKRELKADMRNVETNLNTKVNELNYLLNRTLDITEKLVYNNKSEVKQKRK